VVALLTLTLLFALFFIKDPDAAAAADPTGERQPRPVARFVITLWHFVVDVFNSFWRSGRGPMLGVLFALLPTGAMALAYAILGTLQVDYGLEQASIAQLSVLNTVAGGLGCLAGGVLGDRFGIKRTIGLAYVLTTVPTIYLASQIATVGLTGIPVDHLYAVIVLHGFFYGSAFALSAAIFMGMTNPAVAATQFTAYMGMGNIAISFGNFWQGIVAERIDYSAVLYLDAAVVLISLALIPFLRSRDQSRKTVVGEPAFAAD
jgi:PAT family beta-lactamase induction signal transducer AmpG